MELLPKPEFSVPVAEETTASSVPPLSVVGLVKVLAPLKTRRPAPFFVKPAATVPVMLLAIE